MTEKPENKPILENRLFDVFMIKALEMLQKLIQGKQQSYTIKYIQYICQFMSNLIMIPHIFEKLIQISQESPITVLLHAIWKNPECFKQPESLSFLSTLLEEISEFLRQNIKYNPDPICTISSMVLFSTLDYYEDIEYDDGELLKNILSLKQEQIQITWDTENNIT